VPEAATAPTVSNNFGDRDVMVLRFDGTTWHEIGREGFVQTDPTIPGRPRNVVAEATAGTTVNLTWLAPLNPGGSAVTGYRITPYIASVAQATTTVGNVLSTSVTGLTGDTTYTFKVQAINSYGFGIYSMASGPATTSTPFTTSDPTGMVFWGKTRDLGLVDGDPVMTLNDVSASALHLATFSGLDPPTFDASVPDLNDRPALAFNGVEAFLRSTGTFLPSIAIPRTELAVVKHEGAIGAQQMILSGDGFDGAVYAINRWDMSAGTSLQTSAGTMPFVDNDPHVLIAVFDGASSAFYLDGGTPVVGNAGSSALPRISLGAYGGAPTFNVWNGVIADPIIYNKRLSVAEINRVGRQLAEFYGITWTTVT
jgi:Fibronectin type III domain